MRPSAGRREQRQDDDAQGFTAQEDAGGAGLQRRVALVLMLVLPGLAMAEPAVAEEPAAAATPTTEAAPVDTGEATPPVAEETPVEEETPAAPV